MWYAKYSFQTSACGYPVKSRIQIVCPTKFFLKIILPILLAPLSFHINFKNQLDDLLRNYRDFDSEYAESTELMWVEYLNMQSSDS